MNWRTFIPWLLLAGSVLAALWVARVTMPVAPAVVAPPDRGISIEPTSWADLDGWQQDAHAEALVAFLKSCAAFRPQPDSRKLRPGTFGGTIGDWRSVCEQAARITPGDDIAAREFFESGFTPHAVLFNDSPEGQFTGYYEPVIEGRAAPDDRFSVPLYRRPPELVTVDLGTFNREFEGKRIAGKVASGRLRPFETRAQIEDGALADRGLEFLWLEDPVDAFFLQIQGSGRIRMPDGSLKMVGYDGPNGHPYTSIGRLLVARGEMTLDQASMASIRQWVADNPEAGRKLLHENASFVFFREISGDGPLGAQGVALTPRRSLAVDRAHLPLGAPMWLEIPHPDSPAEAPRSFNRLMVAQDTGGAIVGAIRGDVFWGDGDEAGRIAGKMNQQGRYWILLPNALARHAAVSVQ